MRSLCFQPKFSSSCRPRGTFFFFLNNALRLEVTVFLLLLSLCVTSCRLQFTLFGWLLIPRSGLSCKRLDLNGPPGKNKKANKDKLTEQRSFWQFLKTSDWNTTDFCGRTWFRGLCDGGQLWRVSLLRIIVSSSVRAEGLWCLTVFTEK